MANFNIIDQLHRIDAPTLVLAGEADLIIPLEQGPKGGGGKVISEKIRQARLKVIKNCGHAIFFEKPEEAAKVITSFLRTRKA
ncbi:alpha/beta hydrolase [Candidatus Hecatella orcuttiae]|jgi:pimeloyl-ACP methyl ester carboxylesterase|uniref:alpha/beta fold hydrolase n=1 Tax=Candidatus Hecatella orcuttiae TaxID=1935119 RepID=UPI002867F9B4|nr:alpha/beta hydrolase [Candidatus Hecatella orcuttiae]